MARPAYTLEQHVRKGTFRSRRHHPLLARQPLPNEWPRFARLQARYQAATSEAERRAIGVEFEHAVSDVQQQLAAHSGGGSTNPNLSEQLAAIGKAGSLSQLLGFFPAFLHHTSASRHGEPFQLERWQQAFLREFHRHDRNGNRLYKKGLLGLPRGNGKTTFAAGLGLYELIRNQETADIVVAGGSRDQARTTLHRAYRLAQQGPLGECLLDGRDQLRCRDHNGRVRTIACQGDLQHAASVVLLDDLGSFTYRRHRRTYSALATALHNADDYLLATSSAGDDPSSLLGRIYTAALDWDDVTVSHKDCLTVAKNPDAAALVWWYGAPADADPEDPKILRACNPASWINTTQLQQQLRDPGLNEAEFRRLHLNQWPCQKRLGSRQSPEARDEYARLSFDEILARLNKLPDLDLAAIEANQ